MTLRAATVTSAFSSWILSVSGEGGTRACGGSVGGQGNIERSHSKASIPFSGIGWGTCKGAPAQHHSHLCGKSWAASQGWPCPSTLCRSLFPLTPRPLFTPVRNYAPHLRRLHEHVQAGPSSGSDDVSVGCMLDLLDLPDLVDLSYMVDLSDLSDLWISVEAGMCPECVCQACCGKGALGK